MNGPDGPEQRTADAEERSEREYDELDRTEDRAEYSTSDVADEVRKATADSRAAHSTARSTRRVRMMKGTFGVVLMILSPFIVGGLFLAGIKAHEAFVQWQYERAVQKRNARLIRHSITPFRGTRARQ